MSVSTQVSFSRRARAAARAIVLALFVFGATAPDGFVRSAAATAPKLDVIYVPTPDEVVSRMLEMADVGPDDYVIDLGSGDGRIVISAVRDFSVRKALGIDLDPQRVAEARENARLAGVEDRVVFEEGDLFEKDFSDATVLTMYLLQSINLSLRPVILETLAPGSRVVSHVFNMGEWRADQHDIVDGRNVFLWIVPARVSGLWELTTVGGRTLELSLDQTFQKIGGSARAEGNRTVLTDATLRGAEIRFTIGAERFVGTVDGEAIVPVEEPGAAQGWRARRK